MFLDPGKPFFSSEMPEDVFNRYFKLLQDESYRAFLDMMLENNWPTMADRIIAWLGEKGLDEKS